MRKRQHFGLVAGAEVAQEAREAELAAMPKTDRRENRTSFFRERDTGSNFRPGDVPCTPLRTLHYIFFEVGSHGVG